MIRIILIILLFTLTGAAGVHAAEDDFHTIKRMGQLNGVALSCRYFDETRRIKKALIQSLPKRRVYGKAFEDATNTSYLAFIESRAACPAVGEFTADVDVATQELNMAFPSP